MIDGLDVSAASAFFQVIVIDLVLAADNAVMIGLAAAGLPPELRKKAIVIGIVAATVMRIGFALVTTQLLAIVGLKIAGGLLLLWVCWKMWQELRIGAANDPVLEDAHSDPDTMSTPAPRKTMRQAVTQIVVADVSMSLDNVLAVAGAAGHHVEALIFGLALSVVLMGVASAMIARLLHKYPWVAYVGLAIILYVALEMIFHGFTDPSAQIGGLSPLAALIGMAT